MSDAAATKRSRRSQSPRATWFGPATGPGQGWRPHLAADSRPIESSRSAASTLPRVQWTTECTTGVVSDEPTATSAGSPAARAGWTAPSPRLRNRLTRCGSSVSVRGQSAKRGSIPRGRDCSPCPAQSDSAVNALDPRQPTASAASEPDDNRQPTEDATRSSDVAACLLPAVYADALCPGFSG